MKNPKLLAKLCMLMVFSTGTVLYSNYFLTGGRKILKATSYKVTPSNRPARITDHQQEKTDGDARHVHGTPTAKVNKDGKNADAKEVKGEVHSANNESMGDVGKNETRSSVIPGNGNGQIKMDTTSSKPNVQVTTVTNKPEKKFANDAPIKPTPAVDNETLIILNLQRTNPLYSDRVINPHPFTLFNGTRGCEHHAPEGRVFLVVLVACRPEENLDRALIRSTWGAVKSYRGHIITARFLLARSNKEVLRKMVANESALYGDIIQEDFTDSYRNMTYKVLMGLKWADLRCPNASYVMNLDSDMFVNVFNLVEHLEKAPRTNYTEGRYKLVATPHRSRNAKWYTPIELYPESTYPPYLNGPAYVMSNDLPRRIFDESAHVRYIPWDDVYVGLVMKKLGVQPQAGVNFEVYLKAWNHTYILSTFTNGKALCVGHQLGNNKAHDEIVRSVWREISLKHLNNTKH